MSGGANQVFKDHPKWFLENNIVIVNVDPDVTRKKAGVHTFDLVKVADGPPATYRLYDNPSEFDRPVPDEPLITAHWLPYKADSFQMNNDDKAGVDFIFTATMNGCTYAINDAAANPYVAHVNHRTGGTVNQTAIDDDIQMCFPGDPAKNTVLKAADYQKAPGGGLDNRYNFTTVGVRGPTGKFVFHMQRYPHPGSGLPASVASAPVAWIKQLGTAVFDRGHPGGAGDANPSLWNRLRVRFGRMHH